MDTAEKKDDAALNRRGNAGLRSDVKDANRIYDPALEKAWGNKYKNHSSLRMRKAWRIFAHARHDPFNKSPDWVASIIRRIKKEFTNKSLTPETLFKKVDVTGDGVLERAEVRRLLLGVVPDLGDMELAAIFELIDADHSNEVSLQELNEVIWGKRHNRQRRDTPEKTAGSTSGDSILQGDISGADKNDHRTPVHRVKRLPPACVEGWDHLQRNAEFKEEGELFRAREHEMFKRIGAELCLTPRPKQQLPGSSPKYERFGGGADAYRFRNQQWRKDLRDIEATDQDVSGLTASQIPDPGPDVRPGYYVALARAAPSFANASTRATVKANTPRA